MGPSVSTQRAIKQPGTDRRPLFFAGMLLSTPATGNNDSDLNWPRKPPRNKLSLLTHQAFTELHLRTCRIISVEFSFPRQCQGSGSQAGWCLAFILLLLFFHRAACGEKRSQAPGLTGHSQGFIQTHALSHTLPLLQPFQFTGNCRMWDLELHLKMNCFFEDIEESCLEEGLMGKNFNL